ncbi:preprotein translocase subunit SecG [Paenibacillus gallinarum]|uniref:Protein-export membrane protein SecG n=1 Tax=Paenibacillus gallinarum TaxID=2762232 RepID=A0ABR8T5V4_9BACL|nr:preprotein translocase subunit SecG [Paenibacillus gallinarum]MBD7971153.1 preprotein translocase subunit SecG [Paenibacillus gallinarum]
MELVLKLLLVIFAIGVIVVVLLQQGKSAGLSGAISGGAEHLFGKSKARGMELVLERITVGFAIGFMVLAILVAVVQ